jgi:hypothetical protein
MWPGFPPPLTAFPAKLDFRDGKPNLPAAVHHSAANPAAINENRIDL